jgi:hypothetical protein
VFPPLVKLCSSQQIWQRICTIRNKKLTSVFWNLGFSLCTFYLQTTSPITCPWSHHQSHTRVIPPPSLKSWLLVPLLPENCFHFDLSDFDIYLRDASYGPGPSPVILFATLQPTHSITTPQKISWPLTANFLQSRSQAPCSPFPPPSFQINISTRESNGWCVSF